MILGGADEKQVEQGIAYGQHFGLTFQMIDDLLDVIGDTKTLGKQTGMDARRGKLTWVALRGVDGTREDAAMHTKMACEAIKSINFDTKFFTDLAQSALMRVQ